MRIDRIVPNKIGVVKRSVQTKNSYPLSLSFKGKEAATADDSNISWSGILATTAIVFAVTSLVVLGIKKLIYKSSQKAQKFGQKFRKEPLPEAKLKLDTKKLRAMPTELKNQAKEALNKVVTTDDLQKVLIDYNLWA